MKIPNSPCTKNINPHYILTLFQDDCGGWFCQITHLPQNSLYSGFTSTYDNEKEAIMEAHELIDEYK